MQHWMKKLHDILSDRNVLILGFGREGQSTLQVLRNLLPAEKITIADKNPGAVLNSGLLRSNEFNTQLGDHYLSDLDRYDLIIKTPGISKNLLKTNTDENKLSSQTDLFLKLFRSNIIGITGTKGKSTTSSLIASLLSSVCPNTILVGNIGIAPFSLLDKINDSTRIVFEMSSHQLEDVTVSPTMAIFLNLYQEHLDHYDSFIDYQMAKYNIVRFQKQYDSFIFNGDDPIIERLMIKSAPVSKKIAFSMKKELQNGCFLSVEKRVIFRQGDQISQLDFSDRKYLPGNHNLANIMAAVCVARLSGVPDEKIISVIKDFRGLKHRLEYIGEFGNIHFYDDSIATIPEATMEAVKTIPRTETIILGGYDRGVDYGLLIDFLKNTAIRNFIFIGEAGRRMFNEFTKIKSNDDKNLFPVNEFGEIGKLIKNHSSPGSVCLLSPAASSYGMFSNYIERGDAFRQIVKNL
jgi:UDP-N-acetylmuramoylalanine--D-glutamate ligase